MESPKTGVAILVLLSTVTMLGAGFGWQIRTQQRVPETTVAPPDVRPASDGNEPAAATNASLPAR